MPSLPPILTHALALGATLKYPFLFVGAVVEGPILMVACGFLIHQGFLDPAATFIAIFLGDLCADCGWYAVGRFGMHPFMKRWGQLFRITPERLNRATELFHRYHEKILFISKITLGFGLALVTLITAGASKVPFKTYIALNALGEIILVTTLLGLGYFFAELYVAFQAGLARIPLLAFGVLCFSGIIWGVVMLRRKMRTV